MLPDQFTSQRGWEVDQTIPINKNGVEKIVYPVRKKGVLCAAKIYRNTNSSSGDRVNKVKESRHEFQSYLLTKRSSLENYIPAPFEMIQDDRGNDTGLLVEWKSGTELVEGYRRIYIPHAEISILENILLNLPENIWLNADSISESNVCWDGNQLWLAEPELRKFSSSSIWESVVKWQMKYFHENYCR